MTSLAEEIAALINPAPTSIDPEDNIDFDTKATVVEKYDEDVPVYHSQLRKKNIQLNLGSKYAGKKISRKKLEQYSESESISDDDDDDDDDIEYESDGQDKRITLKTKILSDKEKLSEDLKDAEGEDISDENIESDMDVVDKKDESVDEDQEDEEEEEEEEDDDDDDDDIVQKFSNIDVGEEIEKGKAVKKQLTLWDILLQCRIKLQKLLIIANKFPQPDSFNAFLEEGDTDYSEFTKQGCSSIKRLLDLLLDVQTELLKRNPETSYILDNKSHEVMKNSDEEISGSSDEDDDDGGADKIDDIRYTKKRKLTIDEYPEFLNKRHKHFTSFRNSTIQKWNEKTKLASGKLNQSSFNAFEQSALKQIEQILGDKQRLISRTQLKRSTYRIFGNAEKKEETEISEVGKEKLPSQDHHIKDYDYDVEIFDDDDFYHHLLREIIERKTIDVNDPVTLSRQWLEIQKLRSKMKKKVDTKASKGRKIRFGVHSKMVNFMAPLDNCTVSDEAKNELFHSLFGRKN